MLLHTQTPAELANTSFLAHLLGVYLCTRLVMQLVPVTQNIPATSVEQLLTGPWAQVGKGGRVWDRGKGGLGCNTHDLQHICFVD